MGCSSNQIPNQQFHEVCIMNGLCTPHACLPPAAATMEVVEMVLTGRVNKSLVTLIQQAGGRAVGLCGKDSNILQARQMVEKDIGFVGEVTRVGALVPGPDLLLAIP
jgi:hypothetical protein